MPEDMSDRMPEDLPATKRINVMVRITRSKVIVFFHPSPTQQHWTGRDKKQRPSKERDQLQQTSTSSTCPKKRARGRQEHQPKIPKSNQRRAGKGKGPGNLSLEKRDQKRDQNEMQTRSEPWQQQTPGK